jgi:Tfp pilus assembly protein PilV
MKFLQIKNNPKWLSSQAGFTFVEALVSMIIVTVTLTTLGSLFVSQRQTNVNARLKTIASSLAQYELETLRYSMQNPMPAVTNRQFIKTVSMSRATSQYQYMNFGVEVRIRGLSGTNADGSPNCVSTDTPNARCVRVIVRPFDNSNTYACGQRSYYTGERLDNCIYETETVFTDIR